MRPVLRYPNGIIFIVLMVLVWVIEQVFWVKLMTLR